MYQFLTVQNVTFAIGIIGTLFTIYSRIRNPQIDSDKKDALLAQQVQWQSQANEKKFADLSTRLDNSMTLAQNHIHTVDTKVDGVISSQAAMSNEIIKLATIIDERIPKR